LFGQPIIRFLGIQETTQVCSRHSVCSAVGLESSSGATIRRELCGREQPIDVSSDLYLYEKADNQLMLFEADKEIKHMKEEGVPVENTKLVETIVQKVKG
jgi:hypothetical protein